MIVLMLVELFQDFYVVLVFVVDVCVMLVYVLLVDGQQVYVVFVGSNFLVYCCKWWLDLVFYGQVVSVIVWSWLVFLFGVFWMLYCCMYVQVVMWIGVFIVLFILEILVGVSDSVLLVVIVVISVVVGFVGNYLYLWYVQWMIVLVQVCYFGDVMVQYVVLVGLGGICWLVVFVGMVIYVVLIGVLIFLLDF